MQVADASLDIVLHCRLVCDAMSSGEPHQSNMDGGGETFENFDYMLKVLIVGNSAVGKTSMLVRYTDRSFSEAFVSTVGIDFKVRTLTRNGKKIKLQVRYLIMGWPLYGWYKTG